MTRTRIFAFLLFWAVGAPAAWSRPALEIGHSSNEPVVAGQTIEIRVVSPEQGLAIEVETRPGSRLADPEMLVDTSAIESGKTVSWTASQAGLVRFRLIDGEGAELDRADLAVRYRRRPLSAIFVLAVAGGLLFAGIWIGFRRTDG